MEKLNFRFMDGFNEVSMQIEKIASLSLMLEDAMGYSHTNPHDYLGSVEILSALLFDLKNAMKSLSDQVTPEKVICEREEEVA